MRLEHRNKDATIWLRNVVISNHDRAKDLSVFADNYVEAASGTIGIAVSFGAGSAAAGKRFASRVVSRGACSVSGIPAYRVDFEVANVDQLQLTPDARWIRQRVVLVRAPFEHAIQHRQLKDRLPVVLVAGLSSAPEDFERLARHLDLLLDRVVIGGSKESLADSQTVAHTCRVDEPAPAAPATSPDAEAPSSEAAPGSSAAPVAPASAVVPPASVPATSSPGPAASASGTPEKSPAAPTSVGSSSAPPAPAPSAKPAVPASSKR